MSKKLHIISLVIIVIILAIIIAFNLKEIKSKHNAKPTIKIGVITDLTGPATYWGQSTQAGAELALEELKAQGYNVEFIYEDYQLDANNALSAAQKLINVNHVQAIYSEFNPAAMAVGSLTKELNILHLYDAAPISPLQDAPNTYKTYLDYQAGCREVAQKFKEQGLSEVGMLKLNLEAGDVCLAGIKKTYPNVLVESYNLGDKNFNTPILKMKNQGVEAVINIGFEGETLNTLKALQENNFNIPYGTVDDTITEDVLAKYPNQIKGATSFAFTEVDQEFSQKLKEKLPNKKLTTEYGAGFAYTHLKQMVKALAECDNDSACVTAKMDNAAPDPTIGFVKFNDHIAEIKMDIKQY